MALLEYGTYSFLDVQATISGPGGMADIKSSGVSEEGITITQVSPKDVMTIGAAGNGMHTLVGTDAARVEVSMLKTAPGNSVFNTLYNFGKQSSANWGQLQFTVQNPVTGDSITLLGGAFEKQADVRYAGQQTLMVWPMLFISRDDILGNGGNPRALIVSA